MKTRRSINLPAVGWREWIAFPDLGISRIKAKIDTGARTSSLHVFELETLQEGGVPVAVFKVHPRQRSVAEEIECRAEILERRLVRDSGGRQTRRIVIRTPITLGDSTWEVDLTLADRSLMGFRVLLGRTAIRNKYLVHPGRSYLT